MKLIDLDPRWMVLESGGPKVGLSFECPHCQNQRLAVLFHHDGHQVAEDAYIVAKSPATKHIWMLTGDTFDNMSLSPSVDVSQEGHWHGFIINGEIK